MRIPESGRQPVNNENSYEDQTALRMVWLAFAGWWLSLIWVVAGWACLLVPPLTPVGLRMFANVTRVVALRAPADVWDDLLADTIWNLEQHTGNQRHIAARLAYTLAVGWWLSLLWAVLGWLENLSVERRPAGISRFLQVPAVMTLRRY